MATKDIPSHLVMTNAALELLTCFQDGMDDAVAKIAEMCATDRVKGTSQQAEVTVADVRRAGAIIARFVNTLVASGQAPPAVLDTLRSMLECANCE